MSPLHVYTCRRIHVEHIFTVIMSSKKNKSKSKRASEGDNSLLQKDESSSLQISGLDGGSCRSPDFNSFSVMDFIEKGENLDQESDL